MWTGSKFDLVHQMMNPNNLGYRLMFHQIKREFCQTWFRAKYMQKNDKPTNPNCMHLLNVGDCGLEIVGQGYNLEATCGFKLLTC